MSRLNRRESFAQAAMQSIITRGVIIGGDDVAKLALSYADALERALGVEAEPPAEEAPKRELNAQEMKGIQLLGCINETLDEWDHALARKNYHHFEMSGTRIARLGLPDGPWHTVKPVVPLSTRSGLKESPRYIVYNTSDGTCYLLTEDQFDIDGLCAYGYARVPMPAADVRELKAIFNAPIPREPTEEDYPTRNRFVQALVRVVTGVLQGMRCTLIGRHA